MAVSIRMRWEGEAARMGKTTNAYKVSGRNTLREENPWKTKK
jgi:hypothetical protein